MSGFVGDTYRDSGTATEVDVDAVGLAVRGVMQVTMCRDGDDLPYAVRMGPDSADRLADLLRAAARTARAMP